MNRVDRKVAVVTGGTQGLGVACARALAEGGARGIVTCGRNAEKGEAVARGIEAKHGTDVTFVATDLADVNAAERVASAAYERFGRIDVLVNVAAITDRGTLLDTTPELFDTMMAVNVRAPFFLMQACARRMVRDGTEGAIVNIGSTSALAGQPFISAYCVSKGALATLTRNAAFSLLRNQIRVNQLNIGWMASDGEDRIQRQYHGASDGWQEAAGAELPFGRLVDPDEVARAVRYLASDEAGLMTGSVINYDQSVWGGYPASPPAPDAPMSV